MGNWKRTERERESVIVLERVSKLNQRKKLKLKHELHKRSLITWRAMVQKNLVP